MKWPWVSRGELDAAKDHVRMLTDQLLALQAAYRDLVERTLQMRREGFQPPAEPTPAEPPTPALPTAVADAIDAVSTSGPMARQLHQTALRLLRQEGGDADKVATLIRQGDDPDVLEDFLG